MRAEYPVRLIATFDSSFHATESWQVDPASIVVSFKSRSQVDPNDIALRIYKDYAGFAVSLGVIDKIGTLAEPIQLVINDGG